MNGVRDYIRKELGKLALPAFDWNGKQGLPVRQDALELAQEILLGNHISDAVISALPNPLLKLEENGTISATFCYEDDTERKLYLTFQCECVLTYMKWWEDNTEVAGVIRLDSFEDTFSPDDYVAMTELFEWLAQE